MRGPAKKILILAVLMPFMFAACATTQDGQNTKTIVGGLRWGCGRWSSGIGPRRKHCRRDWKHDSRRTHRGGDW